MTWLSWRSAFCRPLSGHNFHSQAEAAAAAASSQWRRLSKYKPHSYSVYAVTLHIARGSRARCQVHPASTWGLAPSPAPVTAHSPLIIGFYLFIYLVGTGKHQNIIEIPKYLNHKDSSWFYFIFLPIFFYYHFRHCQIDLTTVWPDTAWIFLKILLKLPIHSFGISSIIIAWNCAKMTILFLFFEHLLHHLS